MSTLSVSSIQNASAPQANISLNADGSVTLPVYSAPSTTPPSLVQAGTLWFDTTIPGLVMRNAANTAWLSLSAPPAATLAEAALGVLTTKYSSPETAVPKDASGMTGSAYIPAGTTAQRPTASNYTGQFRYNTTIPELEYSDGAAWLGLGGLSAATLTQAQAGTLATVAATPQTAVPKDASGMTGSAYIPAGTTAQRPTASNYTGQFRYNTTIPQLEYSDGTAWQPVGAALLPASLAEAQAGTITTKYSSPQTAVPKDASGMTGSAYIPAGTTAQRPTASNYTGQFRYNTQIPQLEYSDGTAWVAVVPPAGGVTTFSGGTTGLTPAAATSGAVTLAGILAIANGGTGATTAAAAAAALLPSQAGNAGEVLTTDGTSLSWTPTVTSIVAGTNVTISPAGGTGAVTINASGGGGGGSVTSVTGTAPIAVATGTTTPVISIGAASDTARGAIEIATLAEAATGTSTTLALTPSTGVPKDASGMTGAAIIPNGTTAERAASPANGFFRYNSELFFFEAYVASTSLWFQIPFIAPLPVFSDYTPFNGETLPSIIYCKNFNLAAGVSVTILGSVYIYATGNVVIAGTMNGTGGGPRGAQRYGTANPVQGNAYTGSGSGASAGSGNTGGPAVGAIATLLGSGGSGGFMNAGSGGLSVNNPMPPGGDSGSSVLVRCLSQITVTGSILVGGGAAQFVGSSNASIAVSGGGGGSGGIVILDATGNNNLAAATVQASAGSGANGANGGGGGGGGGGGTIIRQSRTGVLTTAGGTFSVNGGSAGANAGAVVLGGGGGGGCGGAGGDGAAGFNSYTPSAGSNGFIFDYGSPLPS